ncbi:MAG: hypothetical protein LBQ33_04735, partial [Oscillospiraceae bacterium]|nr:hypothetical protein [Oscillospiraceae bacterium]
MKTKKYGAWLVIALLVALPLGFGACGGNGVAQIARGDNLSVAVPTESAAKWVAQDYRDAESGEMTVYTATADANSGTVAQSVPAAVASLSQRKLIKDLSARIETKDFEKYVA